MTEEYRSDLFPSTSLQGMSQSSNSHSKNDLIEEIQNPLEKINISKMRTAHESLETSIDNFMGIKGFSAMGNPEELDQQENLNTAKGYDEPMDVQSSLDATIQMALGERLPATMESLLFQSTPSLSNSDQPGTSDGTANFSVDIQEGGEINMLTLLGLDKYIKDPLLLLNETSPAKSVDLNGPKPTPEKLRELNIKQAVINASPLDFGPAQYMDYLDTTSTRGENKKTFLIFQSLKNADRIYPFLWHQSLSRLSTAGIQYTLKCFACKVVQQHFKNVKPNFEEGEDVSTIPNFSRRKIPEILVLSGRIVRNPDGPDGVAHICADVDLSEVAVANPQLMEILAQANERLQKPKTDLLNGHTSCEKVENGENSAENATSEPKNDGTIFGDGEELSVKAENKEIKKLEAQKPSENGLDSSEDARKMSEIGLAIQALNEIGDDSSDVNPSSPKNDLKSPEGPLAATLNGQDPSDASQDAEKSQEDSNNAPDASENQQVSKEAEKEPGKLENVESTSYGAKESENSHFIINPRGSDSSKATFYESANIKHLVCPSDVKKGHYWDFIYVETDGDKQVYECSACRDAVGTKDDAEDPPIIFVRESDRAIEIDPDTPVSKFLLPKSHFCSMEDGTTSKEAAPEAFKQKNQAVQESDKSKQEAPKNDGADSDIELVDESPPPSQATPSRVQKCLVFAQVPPYDPTKPQCIVVYPQNSIEVYIQGKPLSRNEPNPEKPFVACRSQRYHNHKFLFEWDKKKRRTTVDGETYSCVACGLLKKNFKELTRDITQSFIAGNAEKWKIFTDPDYPLGDEHQCVVKEWENKLKATKKDHEEKKKSIQKINAGLIAVPPDFDSSLSHGSVIFDPTNDQEGLLVFAQSRLYPDWRYEFEVSSSNYLNVGAEIYQILVCHGCKEAKKEAHNSDKIVPQIFVRNTEIIYSNPDDPYNGQHFCIPEAIQEDPTVQRRLRLRRSNVHEVQKEAQKEEEDEFVAEVEELQSVIKFLKVQQDQIDNKIIIHGSKLKKLHMLLLKGEDSLTACFDPNSLKIKTVTSEKSRIQYQFELNGGNGKVLRYQCSKCLKFIQNRPNKAKCMSKIPVIFYNDGRIVTKDVDCPDGHPHWCTMRNAAQYLNEIENPSIQFQGINQAQHLNNALANRANIVRGASPNPQLLPLMGPGSARPMQRPQMRMPNSGGVRQQNATPRTSSQPIITSYAVGDRMECEDDPMMGSKGKQSYFSINGAPAGSSTPPAFSALIAPPRASPPVVNMTQFNQASSSKQAIHSIKVDNNSDSEPEIIDDGDEEWKASNESRKNPFMNRRSRTRVTQRKSTVNIIAVPPPHVQQGLMPFQQMHRPPAQAHIPAPIIRQQPPITTPPVRRQPPAQLPPNFAPGVKVSGPLSLLKAVQSPRAAPPKASGNQQMCLSFVRPSQIQISSMPQKRMSSSPGISQIHPPKRPNLPEQPADNAGFDLMSLLSAPPVQLEVTVGASAVEKPQNSGGVPETKVIDISSEPNTPTKVQKSFGPTPVTTTKVVQQVPEGLNLKELLDAQMKNLK